VIDVNVPKFLTGISVSSVHLVCLGECQYLLVQDPEGDELEEKAKVRSATEELAIYLWENYVE
jgi:hypothetical protein